jgi:membrane-bound metal-dependent hydrolase YbcI (DUF457 family)
MPSPVGHALGGALAGLVCASRPDVPHGSSAGRLGSQLRARVVVVCALVACLPDIDFLWGRHNMETHSLGLAAAAGGVAWVFTRDRRLALAASLAWTSHIAFDWLGSDDTAPLGVMAFWPWSSDFYFAHAYVFDAISRRYWLPGFVAHNLWAVAHELVMLGPVVAAVALLRAWSTTPAASRPKP